MKYKETQKVNDNILFGILIACLIGLFLGFVYSVYTQGILSLHAFLYLSLTCVTGMLLWWLRHLMIKVSINNKRIKFKKTPLEKRSHKIHWNEVVDCRIINEPAFTRWTGSNIHFSNEEWYSFTGRNGLHIETRDGSHYVIGCQNLEKLEKALKKIGIIRD